MEFSDESLKIVNYATHKILEVQMFWSARKLVFCAKNIFFSFFFFQELRIMLLGSLTVVMGEYT